MRSLWMYAMVGMLLLIGACQQSTKPVFVQTSAVQLSKPLVLVDSVFFHDQAQVHVGQVQEGCQVYYSGNDAKPALHGPLTNTPLNITQTTTLSFSSMGNGFIKSEENKICLFKLKEAEVSIDSATAAKAPYNQPSPGILVDQQKASKNFRDGAWLGYQNTNVSLILSLKDVTIRGLAVSFLEDQGSWIFAPSNIQARFYDSDNQLIATVEKSYAAQLQQKGSSFLFLKILSDDMKPTKIILDITSLPTLPDWHPGSGNHPWLFIDEIILL